MSNSLQEFAPNVWTVEGPEVSFFGFPYPTRMVVIRLTETEDGDCAWIWSPIEVSDELAKEIECKAGTVKYIVSPNKLHHFFLKSVQERYPNARVYAPPGLEERKVAAGIRFDAHFGEGSVPEFAKEIDSIIMKGSYFMEEVVFFHRPSKTAIVCDFIQRHKPQAGLTGLLMKLDGLEGENGSTPRDWRITFWPFGKTELRKSRDAILDWEASKLIVAHGTCVDTGASEVMKNAMYWI